MIIGLVLGALALALSIILTPVTRDAFLHLGFVDEPDNDRKLHARSVPRVGGIAVFAAYLGSLGIVALVGTLLGKVEIPHIEGGWWLLGGTAFVFAVGLLDDLVGLRPKQKLLGQVLAASVVWYGGVQIHVFEGVAFQGWLSFLLTISWLVFCTNAFNLIDGMDGLAAGAALFSTLTIMAGGMMGHNWPLVFVTIPLAGCLFGFLRYNFNPASVFLGDCGSLTLGFFLGCAGALWSQKINTFFGLAAPVMALSLPLIDTSLAIARRVLRNRPLFAGDRGHIHHRLLDRGNSPRRAAYVLYGVSALAALFSLLQQAWAGRLSGLITLLFCGLVWLGIQHLGYLEFVYIRWFLAKGTLFRLIDDQIRVATLSKSLINVKSEEEALQAVTRTCHDLGFSEVSIRQYSARTLYYPTDNCQVHIPLGTDHVLVLAGLSRVNRPIALPQLMTAVRASFQTKLPTPLPSFVKPAEPTGFSQLVSAVDLTVSTQ